MLRDGAEFEFIILTPYARLFTEHEIFAQYHQSLVYLANVLTGGIINLDKSQGVNNPGDNHG